MASFFIKSHKLNGNILIMQTEDFSYLEGMIIMLYNRSSKDELFYHPRIYITDNNVTNIELDLSNVSFDNKTKDVFDLYFLIDDKKHRVRSKSVLLKKRRSRYSTDLFYIDDSHVDVAIPYLTINNNLSILYGNASIVLTETCHNVTSKEVISATVDNNNLIPSINFDDLSLINKTFFLAFYSEREESYKTLPFKKDENNANNIHLDKNLDLIEIKKKYKLVVQIKERNTLINIPIKFEGYYKNTFHFQTKLAKKPIIKNHMNLKNIKYNNRIISFKIDNLNASDEKTYQIYVKNRKNHTFYLDVEYKQQSNTTIFEVDLSKFINEQASKPSRWKFYIKIEERFHIEKNRLGLYDMPLIPKFKRFFYDEDIIGSYIVTPYLTNKNGLSIVTRTRSSLHNEMLQPIMEVKNFEKTKTNSFYGSMVLELTEITNFTVTAFILKYRNKTENTNYYFDITEEKVTKHKSCIMFDINLTDIVFEPLYWDVYLQIQIDNRNYVIRVKDPVPELNNSITNEEKDHIIKLSNDFILYPYITRNNGLSLTYRIQEKHEGAWFNFKEKLAFFIYKRFRNYFDKKQIWLVYEKFSETAQDNSYYFFKHVYEHHPDKNIYYIIDKDSADYVNVKNMKDRVIPYMSIKHLVYLIASTLFVSSESKGHAYLLRKQNGELRHIVNEKKFVFLRHGVSGFKNVNYIYMKHGNNNANLLIASSKREKNIVKSNMGYDDDDIVITGLCRWDTLIDKSKENKRKEIMIMPTWRTWLDDVSDDKFLVSDYYHEYTKLLNSDKLQTILQNHHIQLNFFIHPKFKAYIDQFQSPIDNIKIYQFGEVQVNELLMRSSLLITDYSSVAWDFYYLKKPVIFYQFDYDTYEYVQGSYMDMSTELFGDRVFNIDELIHVIQEYINQDFMEKNQYATKRNNYFEYIDQKNCERTFNEIMKNKKKLDL